MGSGHRSSGSGTGGKKGGRVDKPNPINRDVSAERLALVRWESGPDYGDYTPNCPLKWVLDFDEDTWDRTTVYAVEWRTQPKPARGWPVLDAVVLEVSCNSAFLEKCCKRLQDTPEGDQSEDESTASPSHLTSPSRSSMDLSKSLGKQSLEQLIQSAVADAISGRSQLSPGMGSDNSLATSAEVINIGHDVMIPAHVHSTAMALGSPSRMTTMLLQAAYKSDQHLIGKTYAGQKKTIGGVVHQKPGIKRRKKVVAIQALVFKKHPTYTRSAFGQSINNYIAKLSSPSRKPNETLQLEDDTDEEM